MESLRRGRGLLGQIKKTEKTFFLYSPSLCVHSISAVLRIASVCIGYSPLIAFLFIADSCQALAPIFTVSHNNDVGWHLLMYFVYTLLARSHHSLICTKLTEYYEGEGGKKEVNLDNWSSMHFLRNKIKNVQWMWMRILLKSCKVQPNPERVWP